MAGEDFERDVLRALIEQGSAVGKLASDKGAFRAAYEAFRKEDAGAFQAALAGVNLVPHCFEICEWVRTKECVFLCLKLAGPPEKIDRPDPRQLAETIVRITADDATVHALATAVDKGDRDAFQRIVEAHDLAPIIHLFCHWVCVVRLRLVCRVVCVRTPAPRPDFVDELRSAGKALRGLLAQSGAFDDAVAASDAGDAEKLGSIIDGAGLIQLCPFICEFFCSWRCTLVCLRLVGRFPPQPVTDELAEAHAFALGTQRLAADARLEPLSAAVGAGDAGAFTSLVTQLELHRFALQLCHWICSLRCWLFCRIVCPPVQCALTDPTGCAAEQADPVAGLLFVPVHGTAGGSGSYTLMINSPVPAVITYPGGSTTSGTAPIINGELGRISTVNLTDGNYTITLNVHSGGLGSPVVCTRTIAFSLLKLGIYISDVAGVAAQPSPFDETAELVTGGQVGSFGGSLNLRGSAYVYGCATQQIERYELRYTRVATPGPGPAQPATDVPIPAAWPAANQLHGPLVYDPTKYYPCTRVGEAPTNLINDWGTMHVGPPAPNGADYPILSPSSWQSRTATGTGGGRYSLLLIVRDTLNHNYYDLQRIWVDNWSVLCEIVKFQRPGPTPGSWQDIPKCTDILISWKRLRIIGLAWDHLIDNSWPQAPPNDNFDQYGLSFHKQFVASEAIPILPTPDHPALAATVRVPNTLVGVPTSMNADLLAQWNLTALDAGPAPAAGCAAPLPPGVSANALYRGCSCTYDLSLGVSDKTITESVGEYSLHHPSFTQPLKIVNDLP